MENFIIEEYEKREEVANFIGKEYGKSGRGQIL